MKVATSKSQKMRKTSGAAARGPCSAKAEEAAKVRQEARRKMMEEKRKMIKLAATSSPKDQETVHNEFESFICKSFIFIVILIIL